MYIVYQSQAIFNIFVHKYFIPFVNAVLNGQQRHVLWSCISAV